MSSLFQVSQKVFKIGCVARQLKQQTLMRCWRAGLPSPTGRGGTDNEGRTQQAPEAYYYTLACWGCFAVLHAGLLLNFGGVSLFCILF